MKKITMCVLTALMLLIFAPTQSNAATNARTVSTAAAGTAESAQANTLLLRLDKINAMDKTALSSIERKELRKEVRSIKSQLSALSGGVYLSVGAILIILLVLIVLL